MKYFSGKIIIILVIFCLYSPLSAYESKVGNSEKQYKLQRYEDIKHEQKKEYKNGVYNDTKKDYVNEWIDKDINYQKKVIKLKKEYREWAIDKISKKQKVRFKDYEPLETMTRVEKQILYEYHNILFKNQKKQKTSIRRNKKKRKRTPIEKTVEENTDRKININSEIPTVPYHISMKEDSDNKYFYHILASAAGILIVIVSIVIFIKNSK